jgi:hypothetical protein
LVEPGQVQRGEDDCLDLACLVEDRMADAERRLATDGVALVVTEAMI